jgi:cytochrome c-type biogenesis protein CcmH/NrfG
VTLTGRGAPAALPHAARRLRLPLWDRSQKRLRDRYGWDLSAGDAVERATALVTASPDDAEAHLLLAAALSMRGDGDGALAAVRRAGELDPSSARAETTLATILVQQGDPEAGLTHARRAAGLDPEDPHVLFNLGLVMSAAGDRRAARDAFERTGELIGVPVTSWWRRRKQAPNRA